MRNKTHNSSFRLFICSLVKFWTVVPRRVCTQLLMLLQGVVFVSTVWGELTC